MSTPTYSSQEIWDKIRKLSGHRIESLTGRSSHTILEIDETRRRYRIRYNTSSSSLIWIGLDKLYALYNELYRLGRLTNGYLSDHWAEIVGGGNFHAPGRAMMAILPRLDENVEWVYDGRMSEGELRIRTRNRPLQRR